MNSKSAVVKSRSSNTAIKPNDSKNKKSISNANIKLNTIKKRGMYVNRKFSTAPLYAKEANDVQKRKPPKPRPGPKQFLASVLTILSKSTTGTQYPDIKEDDDKETKLKSKYRLEYDLDGKQTKSKHKYKSRVLNKNTNKDEEQFIVLQSKKDIFQTPSNYSEAITVTDAETDKTQIRSIKDILENNVYSGVAEGVAREVLEGSTVKREKKIRINDEPETLMTEIVKEDDKKLYSLFVDLLESTFNAYNVKEDVIVSDGSKTVFEIDESVAKKLIVNKTESFDNFEPNTNKYTPTAIKEQLKHTCSQEQHMNIKLSDYRLCRRDENRIRTKSFTHTKKNNIAPTYSIQSKRRSNRNSAKRNLLNLIKEQLETEQTYEQPQNIFQALKVMAKNKKQHNKTIHFMKPRGQNDKECMFKSRDLINLKPKKKHTKESSRDKISKRYSEFSNNTSKNKENIPEYLSNHSLEVFEYDFEDPMKKTVYQPKKQPTIKRNSPTPSKIEFNSDYYVLLQYPDNSMTDFY